MLGRVVLEGALTGTTPVTQPRQARLGVLAVTWQLTPLVVTLHLLLGFTTLSL
jgi:heme A synthase